MRWIGWEGSLAESRQWQTHRKIKISNSKDTWQEQKEGVKVFLFQKLSRFPLGLVEGNQEGFTNGD